jgi:hypothetical protein
MTWLTNQLTPPLPKKFHLTKLMKEHESIKLTCVKNKNVSTFYIYVTLYFKDVNSTKVYIMCIVSVYTYIFEEDEYVKA